MWDYGKLFAEGNIIGIKKPDGKIYHIDAGAKQRNIGVLSKCYNDSLSFDTNNGESFIQYIIRLDEHGNVVERLFDRERDMAKPMPKLETGMFVKVIDKKTHRLLLGFVYKEDNRVIYQCGTYDHIYNIIDGEFYDIAEIFSSEATSYSDCYDYNKIWYNPKYQVYIN